MKDWRALLDSPDGAEVPVREFDVLQKSGRPFLYLPKAAGPARKSLRLYPAQKFKAKAFLSAIHLLVRCGLPVPGPHLGVPIDPRSSFGKFLRNMVPEGDGIPLFGVLEGYLRNPRQRYLLLLFDAYQQPYSVVKVGLHPEARQLIRQERGFFTPPPPVLPGIPELLGFYEADDAEAIAYPYCEGRAATYDDRKQLGAVLSPWVADGPLVPAAKSPMWAEVQVLENDAPHLKPLFDTVARTPMRTALAHRDFAAWNVRISAHGEWRILDWERARQVHFPAWDWFNFIVQFHLLVFKSDPTTTITAIEELWEDPEFCAYADLTGIRDILKEHTVTYLLYMRWYFGLTENPDLAVELQRVAEGIERRHFSSVAP